MKGQENKGLWNNYEACGIIYRREAKKIQRPPCKLKAKGRGVACKFLYEKKRGGVSNFWEQANF